jgi:hypothetical protein
MKATEGIQRLDASSFERMLKDVVDMDTGRRKLACISRDRIPETINDSAFSDRYRGACLKQFVAIAPSVYFILCSQIHVTFTLDSPKLWFSHLLHVTVVVPATYLGAHRDFCMQRL